MSLRFRTSGLRARLLTAFALVTMLGAGAAAWSSTGSASTALVASNQHRYIEAMREQIAATAPTLTFPPDQQALDRLRDDVGTHTLVRYKGLESSDGTVARLVTPGLRSAVRRNGRVASQRVVSNGHPMLLIGAPISTTAPDGTRRPSGVEVYNVRDLSGVEQQVDGLTRSAITTAALALPLAVLLALLASGSVLRPVRNLRDTARRLAAGDLDARSPTRGTDELADLTRTINEMAESVQASMAAMQHMQADAKRFAADVSHELRTPLSTLTAVMEVLAATSDQMEPDARESAQLAITETQRLTQLVEDLMEISRFDAGSAPLRLDDTDLARVVSDALRARGWLGQVELSAPTGIRVRLDPRRIDVIVANLVANALRHGAPPVRTRVTATHDELLIEVEDNGPGLAPDVLSHAFDRFFKADAARGRTPGSGLGLAIAMENAQLHGGDLTVENRRVRGARFTVRIPRREVDA